MRIGPTNFCKAKFRAGMLILVLKDIFQVLVLILGGQVLVLYDGGQVLVLVGQVLALVV